MTDRLEQIWKGFAGRTSLNLSGTGVENTPRPDHAERPEATTAFDAPIRVPTNGEEPSVDTVKAALTAMHTAMSENASRRGRAAAEPMAATQLPPDSLDRTVFADVAYTESKTRRGGSDYIAYAADRQANWQTRKKKWFFGLF